MIMMIGLVAMMPNILVNMGMEVTTWRARRL